MFTTADRIYWNERFPKYAAASRLGDRAEANRIAEQIAREVGVDRVTVHMVGLNRGVK